MAIGKTNDGVVRLEVAADQLIWLANADDFAHSRHFFQASWFDCALVTRNTNGGALRAGNRMRTQSQRFDLAANLAHLFFSRMRLHYNQHLEALLRVSSV